MRFAFISDIHGNLQALELVLDDIKSSEPDQIICLGDVASLGPEPLEVIARLKEMNIPIIMGNHDMYLLNPELTKDHHPWLRESELWCVSKLTTDDLDFLHTFVPQKSFKLNDDTTMLCFHGSPRSNEEFLFPDVSPSLLDENFNNQNASILVGGHTHVQMIRQHKHMALLNPGSVGMPFEFPMRGQDQHAFRRAEYALVDMTDGKLNVEMRRLPIDFEKLEKVTLASGMPGAEIWLSTWSIL